MLPKITELEYRQEDEALAEDLGVSFYFDFRRGEFAMENGRPKQVDGIDGIKIWIEKLLRTEKFKFRIYERDGADEYGVTIMDLIIGYNLPVDFLLAELKREVTQGLMLHPKITGTSNWRVQKNNPVVDVSFNVILTDGNTFTQEVRF